MRRLEFVLLLIILVFNQLLIQRLVLFFALTLLVYFSFRKDFEWKPLLKRFFSLLPFVLLGSLSSKLDMSLLCYRLSNATLLTALLTHQLTAASLALTLKRFYFPKPLISIFVMTLVFIFSFLENVSVIQKSMRIKGAFKRKNLSEASFVGTAIGNLFVLTVFKARQLEKNMLLKGSDD